MMEIVQRFLDLFRDPARAIGGAKRKKDIWITVGLLVIVSTLIGLSCLIIGRWLLPLADLEGAAIAASGPTLMGSMGIVCLLAVFSGGLFLGYLVRTVFRTLCGKGGYFEGLTAVTYSMVGPSVGLLLAFIAAGDVMIGLFIGPVILAVTVVLGVATFFRALKELFGTDLMTAFVGTVVLWISFVVVVYFLVAILAMSGMSGLVPSPMF